jgi:hypothetical protein
VFNKGEEQARKTLWVLGSTKLSCACVPSVRVCPSSLTPAFRARLRWSPAFQLVPELTQPCLPRRFQREQLLIAMAGPGGASSARGAGSSLAGSRSGRSTSTSTSVRGRATAGQRRRLAGQVSKSPLFLSHRGHRLPRRACQAKKTLLRCPQSVPQRLDRTASRHLGGRRYLKYRPPSRYPRYRPPLGSCPATARWNAAELRPTNCAGRGGWRPAPLRQSIPCHAGESRVHLTVASLTPSPACSSSRGPRRARDATGIDLCMRLARMTLGTVL